MYSFNNDYSEGAHPKILEAMMNCNLAQNGGYGLDIHCENARRLIKEEIGRNDADVHFITGGTQTNLITIAAALRPWQAVIATDKGHINVHETGAIEATGHKVLAMPSKDGKLTPELVIGVPVGFVNVVQSKELILSLKDTPYIVARGRKGGSNIAACICNALLYML